MIDGTHVLKFTKPIIKAPAINKGLDWVFAYPLPTRDSPFSLTPLSILFPGKMMEDQGLSVVYWDARWDPPEMLDDYLKEAKNCGVSAFTGYQCSEAADILERAKQLNPSIVNHLGGHHARLCTEDVRKEPFVDQVWPERQYHETSFPFSKEAQRLWKRGDLQMITSSGCPYACLRGDTLVNTIFGSVPIKELAEFSDSVPVYTYKDGEVFISDAINIRKTGVDRELVRVRFDDATHIDCTPDHRFLQFKWGNKEPGVDEWEVEAKDLKPGAHLRALRTEVAGAGYAYITWARRKRRQRSRLAMDYLMGRKLGRTEQVHHKDRNTMNDSPDNLEYCASQKAHIDQHPEFAQRMRENNPAKNMTPEWRAKIGAGVTGKVRTPEQRERYRQSKLGAKNPNYDPSLHEVNHVVVSVEPLTEREDVYCMEVPETGWFFANDVLVHNCTFCALRSQWAPRPLDQLEREINLVHDLTGFKEVSFCDPNIGYHKHKIDGVTHHVNRIERMNGIGKILNPLGIRWDGNVRSDYITPEYAAAIAESGCYSLEFGCESGDEWFLKNIIKKGHGTESIRNANRCFSGSGVSIMNSWVKGMPFETEPQWLNTMGLIDEVNVIAPEARHSVYRFTPYPGGPAFDWAIRGEGIEKFTPPTTMRGWGELRLMVDHFYWVTGLCFRMDNTMKNFPGEDYQKIKPLRDKAMTVWRERRIDDFTMDDVREVEALIAWQVRKHTAHRTAVTA